MNPKLKNNYNIGDNVFCSVTGQSFVVGYVDNWGFNDDVLNEMYPDVYYSNGVKRDNGSMTCYNEKTLTLKKIRE